MGYIESYTDNDQRDIIGQKLEVGDFVIFSKSSDMPKYTSTNKKRGDEQILARILKFTKKGLKVWSTRGELITYVPVMKISDISTITREEYQKDLEAMTHNNFSDYYNLPRVIKYA